MEQIPDAPWIQEAELYGPPEPDAVCCPVCGEECNEIYTDMTGTAVGCEHCMQSMDALQWAEWEREKDE